MVFDHRFVPPTLRLRSVRRPLGLRLIFTLFLPKTVRAGSLIRCEKYKRSATAFQKNQRHFEFVHKRWVMTDLFIF
jgi:hypothetical protein